MSTASTRSAESRPAPLPEPVSWHCWPLIDGAPWSLLTLLLPPAIAWGIQAAMGSWLMGILVAAALVASVWRYWIPVHWRCDEHGLSLRVLAWQRRFPWSCFHGFRYRNDGILMLPSADAVPIDALRAVYVPWGKRRADVCRHIEWRLERLAQGSQAEESASRTQLQQAAPGHRKKPASTATGSLHLFFDFFR